MGRMNERTVHFGNGFSGQVSCNSPVFRYPENPVLKASDVNAVWTDPALQVVTVHNAGITMLNGETLMLFRSHLRNGRSILGLARSSDGCSGWRIDLNPVFTPASHDDSFATEVDPDLQIETEAGGVEDPRVMCIEGEYIITYSAYHARVKNLVRVCLATTADFRQFVRFGPMLQTDMRNVVLFPEKIGNRYYALFRPNDITRGDLGGTFTQIRLGSAENWKTGTWNIQNEPVMKTGGGPSAFSDKIGPGAPPIRTSRGWLNLFHGVRSTMSGNPYVLGVALHDLENPAALLMSNIPILFPTAADCKVSDSDYIHVPHVVFTCGALRREDGTILIYYGGNDTVMNIGITHEDILFALCKNYNQDPHTGKILY